MKIKKFRAKSFSEALAMVRREMGEDAVILASEEQERPFPGVEVTAAVDYEQSRTSPPAASRETQTVGLQAPARQEGDGLSAVRREIEGIREAIEEMKNRGFELGLPEDRRKLFRYLLKQSIREDVAVKLCAAAADIEGIAAAMASEIRTYDDVRNRKVIMLIGPTGVGKTTTLAKLAARAVRNGKRVAMISLDTYRIGAAEQIRIYAKIMGIPLDIVPDAAGLKQSAEKFGSRDIIFVDTTGRNPRDAAYVEELKEVYRLGLPVETHLLMSAHSDAGFLDIALEGYRTLPVDCLGFTKTDEAATFGSIYSLASLFRKPVAYITTGQRVPQDIAFPNAERLSRMVLDSGVPHA